jgi:transcription antitermination factor NusG
MTYIALCKSQGEALHAQQSIRGETGLPSAWFAAYTRFQHEKSAAKLLENKGFEVFLPAYRTVHRWKDRNQTVVLPLFPCYLFLRTELDRKVQVLQTAGIRWLVENSGRACEVATEEIEALQRICAMGTRVQPHEFLRAGDLVRIRSGPLIGTQGFFIRAKKHCRVVVSVELLRKSVSVEVDLRDVEARRKPVIPFSYSSGTFGETA